jgi:hypothetical protein
MSFKNEYQRNLELEFYTFIILIDKVDVKDLISFLKAILKFLQIASERTICNKIKK